MNVKEIIIKIVAVVIVAAMAMTSNPQMLVLAAENISSSDVAFEQQDPVKYDDPNSIDETKDDETEDGEILSSPELEKEYDSFEKKYGKPVSISQYEKTYQKDSETYLTVISYTPNTYLDQRGREQEIDNTLVKKTSFFSGSFYQNKANSYVVKLPEEMDYDTGAEYISEGVDIELIPLEGEYNQAVAEENAILYNNVFENVDVQYTIHETNVKEYIVLNKAIEKNTFQYELKANGSNVEVVDNTIVITKAGASEPDMLITAPQMADAAGETSEALTLSVERVLGHNVVTLTADSSWLNAPERSYPVKIDPTVEIVPENIGNVTYMSDLGTYGGGSYSFVGKTSYGEARIYYRPNFDFSSIPKEAKINSAQLRIYQYTTGSSDIILECYMAKSGYAYWGMSWSDFVNIEVEPASPNYIQNSGIGFHSFDISTAVNYWVQGLYLSDNVPNGLVVKAQNPTKSAPAFYTTASTAEKQSGFTEDKAPHVLVEWSVPDPVDVNISVDATTVEVRPIIETSVSGTLNVLGISFDGIAKPGADVLYEISDPSKEYTNVVPASFSYKYPDTSTFESVFPPKATKYRDKFSNWQTVVPFVEFEYDMPYHLNATAAYEYIGKTVQSDKFLVYKIKRFDTLPKIAAYYGVPMNVIGFDNRVQDVLLVENNTLFIRNPVVEEPYNPGDLTVDEKMQIDAMLMGRGLHCEFGYEPVNLNTGNFVVEHEDYAITDFDGEFSILRTYNSKGAAYNSIFGRGWSFDYAQYLSKTAEGDIVYMRGDGSSICFEDTGDGYACPDGYYLDLKKVKVDSKTVDLGEGDETYDVFEYEITDAQKNTYRFDRYGSLVRVTNIKGHSVSFGYDENQNLSTLTTSAGSRFAFEHDQCGRISVMILPNGSTVEYTYDDKGNLVAVKDAMGGSVTYNYDDQHRMISWADENGKVVTENTYDDSGRVTMQKDGNGSATVFAYEAGKTIITDGDGYTTTYYYDDTYRTHKIEYADGTCVEYGYDDNNNLAWEKDELGRTTSYEHDGNGNVIKVTRFDGAVASYEYNSMNLVTREVGFDGAVQTYEYNAAGDITRAVNAAGKAVSCEYDGEHRLTRYVDTNGNATAFTYNGALVASAKNADGHTVSYSYNSDGMLTSASQPDGGVMRYMYDGNRRKTGEQMPEGEYTGYSFDKAGSVVAIADPNGNTSTFKYDGNGKITRGSDPLGGTISYAYDARGNVIRETDADGNTTSYAYDCKSNLIAETDADGYTKRYGYDGAGNIISMVDGNGNRTTYTYDYRFDEISSIVDAMGNKTTYSYSDSGNVVSVVNPDGTEYKYTYDALERLTGTESPNGLKVKYTYDNNGNLLSTSDNTGRKITNTYNAENLPVSTVDANGNKTEYSYDACQRLTAIEDSLDGVIRLGYDKSGRNTSIKDENGNQSTYEFDANGNIVKETDPNGNSDVISYNKVDNVGVATDANGASTQMVYTGAERLSRVNDAYGNSVKYSYNGRGLPTRITDALGSVYDFVYDGNGNLVSYKLPDGNTTTCVYDALNRVTRIEEQSGKVTEYTYDSMGRVTSEIDNAGNEYHYAYDCMGNLVEAENALGQTAGYEYDLCGNVLSETAYDGTTASYTYDLNNNIIASVDPESRKTEYTYDKLDRLVRTKDDSGREWKYAYDAGGRLTKFTDPSGAVESYAYDKADNLVRSTDAAGNSITYTYDGCGNLISQKDKNGNETTLGYDALGRVISCRNADGGVKEFKYDANSQLVSQKDELGNVTEYAYDCVGNMTAIMSPEGGLFKYTYDDQYNTATETDPLGNVTSMSYDLNGNLKVKELANGGSYRYDYDEISRVTKVSAPGGQSVTFTYDEHNDIVSQRDNGGRVTGYTYDVMHRVTQVVDPKGNATSYTYDVNGNLANVVTPSGASTSYAYDVLDRITAVTDAKGNTSKIAYDVVGNVSSIVNEAGNATKYGYDANGNLIKVTDALGGVSRNTYDSMNRVVKATDEAGDSTSYTYNEAGQLVGIKAANGGYIGMTYDANGNLESVTDAVNRIISYEYDLNDQLIEVTQGDAVTKYTYDCIGNVASVTNGEGGTTEYAYDLASRLVQTKNPLEEITAYNYDRNGNLAKITQADGSEITYDYDALDALVSKEYSEEGTPSVMYGYDSEGRCVTMEDFSGKNGYEYDELGRLTSVTMTSGEKISYKYDECGNIIKLVYPDGTSVRYTYDALNRLTEVVDRDGQTTAYVYDAVGDVVKVTRPNGTYSDIEYNNIGAVTGITNYLVNEDEEKEDEVVSSYEYQYDLNGSIVYENAVVDGKRTVREFEYDDRSELSSETVYSGLLSVKKSYEYDDNGNRTKVTTEKGTEKTTVSYEYDAADRLVRTADSVNGETLYTYDANGNRATKSGSDGILYSYEYDSENRLRAVKDNGALLMAALYDGNGERVFTVNRSTKRYTESVPEAGVESETTATGEPEKSGLTENADGNGLPQGTIDVNVVNDQLPSDPADTIFWYGFGQGMINRLALDSGYLSVWFNEAWQFITGKFDIFSRSTGEFGRQGTNENGQNAAHYGPKPSQELKDQMYLYQTMLIPYGFNDKTEEDYELLMYVNDVNRPYTEALVTYGTDGYVNTVYTYGNERLISEQFGKSSYYSYNGRGDVSELSSTTGSPTVSYSYDAFGAAAATSANDNPYNYNAEAVDYSTGLQYLRARYYDNSVGGFITKDTYAGNVVDPLTLNLYTYTGNNPLNAIDPSGHSITLAAIIGISIAAVTLTSAVVGIVKTVTQSNAQKKPIQEEMKTLENKANASTPTITPSPRVNSFSKFPSIQGRNNSFMALRNNTSTSEIRCLGIINKVQNGDGTPQNMSNYYSARNSKTGYIYYFANEADAIRYKQLCSELAEVNKEEVSGIEHNTLDALSIIPEVGAIFDIINAALYAEEGDYGQAALSASSAAVDLIPFGKIVSKVPGGEKLMKFINKIDDKIDDFASNHLSEKVYNVLDSSLKVFGGNDTPNNSTKTDTPTNTSGNNTKTDAPSSKVKTDFYISDDGTAFPANKSNPNDKFYDRFEYETYSPTQIMEKDVIDDWNEFLGPNQTSIDPRTGIKSDTRIWSEDGTRSIRFDINPDGHEFKSLNTTKAHYHKETWYDGYIINETQRVKMGE